MQNKYNQNQYRNLKYHNIIYYLMNKNIYSISNSKENIKIFIMKLKKNCNKKSNKEKYS